MKSRYVLFSAVLTCGLMLPMFGHPMDRDRIRPDMKEPDMSSIMGKPTVDTTVEGRHLRVWLMTLQQHKEMMEGKPGTMVMHGDRDGPIQKMEMKGKKEIDLGMLKDLNGVKHEDKGMQKAMRDSMMAGTHHIVLDVIDDASGKEVAEASAKVLVMSPSMKSSSVDLKRMMGHFGGALTLDERGQYRLAVSVTVDGVSRTNEFSYSVK
jgi:hypothetical protein